MVTNPHILYTVTNISIYYTIVTVTNIFSGYWDDPINILAMENYHVSWENPLFPWPFSIAMLVITRGYIDDL